MSSNQMFWLIAYKCNHESLIRLKTTPMKPIFDLRQPCNPECFFSNIHQPFIVIRSHRYTWTPLNVSQVSVISYLRCQEVKSQSHAISKPDFNVRPGYQPPCCDIYEKYTMNTSQRATEGPLRRGNNLDLPSPLMITTSSAATNIKRSSLWSGDNHGSHLSVLRRQPWLALSPRYFRKQCRKTRSKKRKKKKHTHAPKSY